MGDLPASLAVKSGLPVVAIAAAHPVGAWEFLLARQGITSIAQLRGQPVAYTTGTSQQAFALRALKSRPRSTSRPSKVLVTPLAETATFRDAITVIDRARAWPVTLSGGEAQRVALARALVREPRLMLLDEPFGALDALTRSRMHTLLQDLCARHQPAVLLVTHDVDEAILLADRVVVLADGGIAADLPVSLDRPRDRGHAGFARLRDSLLAGLGVTELAAG